MTDRLITWEPVHAFVGQLLAGRTTHITAGTPEWIALDDDDPRKTTAVLIAGSRWALEQELDEIHWQRGALKRAAEEVSAARDWAAVAQHIRDRDQWYRDNPDLRRKVS